MNSNTFKGLEVIHSRVNNGSSVNPDDLHAAHIIKIINPPSSKERHLIGIHIRGSSSSKLDEYIYLSFKLSDSKAKASQHQPATLTRLLITSIYFSIHVDSDNIDHCKKIVVV